MISKKERINEGAFYFDELAEYLKEWKSPLCVNLHLDDTRIINRIEYDPLTDRYVGFVLPLKDGLPICDAYVFGTFQEISHAYKACFLHMANFHHQVLKILFLGFVNIKSKSKSSFVSKADNSQNHISFISMVGFP